MHTRDPRPKFETGPAGFTRTSPENLLAALEGVLPPEMLSKVRAGLKAKHEEGATDESNESN